MPVSAALLVTGQPGGTDATRVATNPAFIRGDKGTSSVKLRKKRDDPNQGQMKKKNRHSGDFYAPRETERRKEQQVKSPERQKNAGRPPPNNQGDWNYVTFPNGVPIVHELKTNGNAANVPKESVNAPIKVTMREVPGISPVKQRTNLHSSRAVSASVTSIQQEHNSNRASGDFSKFHGHHHSAVNRIRSEEQQQGRGRPHGRSQSQQPARNCKSPEQSVSSHPQPYLHVTPPRQKTAKPPDKVTKQCSDEFEFKRLNRSSGDFSHLQHVLSQELCKEEERQIVGKMISKELLGDTGSEGSEESGIFSTGSSQESPRKVEMRRPGLGRRAITQLNIQHNNRKNSYNNALAKSQENLVKVLSDDSADDVLDVDSSTIKKGLLWQQRDKLFSRWKERYFILTKDFLQCFKKESSKITEMGGFIFKVKLSEVDHVELLDKRGYLTICINTKEGKIYLRKTEGIRDWYNSIMENMNESKSRKYKRTSAIFADRRQNTDSSSMENWMESRKLDRNVGISDSTPEINKVGEKSCITLDELSRLYKNEEEESRNLVKMRVDRRENDDKTRQKKKINRLSLMSDIDLLDFTAGSDLGIDFEKGIFLRRNKDCNGKGGVDSGNNSMNTNKSNSSSGSTKLGHIEATFVEEDEDQLETTAQEVKPLNRSIIEVRYRERPSCDIDSRRSPVRQTPTDIKRRSHVNRLQITHV